MLARGWCPGSEVKSTPPYFPSLFTLEPGRLSAARMSPSASIPSPPGLSLGRSAEDSVSRALDFVFPPVFLRREGSPDWCGLLERMDFEVNAALEVAEVRGVGAFTSVRLPLDYIRSLFVSVFEQKPIARSEMMQLLVASEIVFSQCSLPGLRVSPAASDDVSSYSFSGRVLTPSEAGLKLFSFWSWLRIAYGLTPHGCMVLVWLAQSPLTVPESFLHVVPCMDEGGVSGFSPPRVYLSVASSGTTVGSESLTATPSSDDGPREIRQGLPRVVGATRWYEGQYRQTTLSPWVTANGTPVSMRPRALFQSPAPSGRGAPGEARDLSPSLIRRRSSRVDGMEDDYWKISDAIEEVTIKVENDASDDEPMS